MMRSSSQFILGFLIGITMLVAGVAGATYLVLSSMAYSPPKPIFSEEAKPPKSKTKTAKTNQPSAQPTEASQAEPEPEAEPEEPEEELPSGAYRATVTWSEGLSIRAEPELDAERIGGVEYNREVIVLKESGDRSWQQIRIPDSELEGWVKSGNIEKTAE